MRRLRILTNTLLVSAAAALLFTGCPEIGESTGGPVDTCVEAGVQCRYAPGKIGVCFANTKNEIVCRSQH